jgi:hypothetical protein
MVITFSENSYTSLFAFSGADFGLSRYCWSVVEIYSAHQGDDDKMLTKLTFGINALSGASTFLLYISPQRS